MDEIDQVACRRSTATRIDNDDGNDEEEERGNEEREQEEKEKAAPVPVLDGVCVNMAGNEITQKQQRSAEVTVESSTSRSRTVESNTSLPSAASSSSSQSMPPPPHPHPPLKPASAWRSSEGGGGGGRDGGLPHHRVTFAEPCNKYVHSDSGIVLSPEDDNTDVTGGGGGGGGEGGGGSGRRDRDNGESDDDVSDDDVDDASDDVRGRRHPRLAPVNANAVPGPPIIKLHRCRSTESQDNPFLFDGELSRKADYIITHSTFLRTYVRVADPDQIPMETENTKGQGSDCVPSTAVDISRRCSATPPPDLSAVADPMGGGAVRRSDSPPSSATPQRSALKAEPLPTRQNGDMMERPLLSPLNKNNKDRQSKSKRGCICCIVQ